MERSGWWCGLGVVALLLSATAARAQNGCEYTTAIDFFEHVVMPDGDCRWVDDRGVYQCRKGSVPTWELLVDVPEPGVGRATAFRDDGLGVPYVCSCEGSCGFESPAPLGGSAPRIDPGNWICSGDASRYHAFSEDLWGVDCFSQQGGMYAQVQGYTLYNDLYDDGQTQMWLFVFNGDEERSDDGCSGRLSCSVMFWEPDGPPHEFYRGEGEHGIPLDFIVSRLQLQCFCE